MARAIDRATICQAASPQAMPSAAVTQTVAAVVSPVTVFSFFRDFELKTPAMSGDVTQLRAFQLDDGTVHRGTFSKIALPAGDKHVDVFITG